MAAMVSRFGISVWAVRVAFAAVFAVNVQCALSFAFAPEQFVGGFMLDETGRVGETAVAGLGVAFLMWNATYPAFIVAPARFRVLGWVILMQQLIGLVGESCLYFGLGPGFDALDASLMRFIVFDGVGFGLMAVAFGWILYEMRKKRVL